MWYWWKIDKKKQLDALVKFSSLQERNIHVTFLISLWTVPRLCVVSYSQFSENFILVISSYSVHTHRQNINLQTCWGLASITFVCCSTKFGKDEKEVDIGGKLVVRRRVPTRMQVEEMRRERRVESCISYLFIFLYFFIFIFLSGGGDEEGEEGGKLHLLVKGHLITFWKWKRETFYLSILLSCYLFICSSFFIFSSF